MISVGSSGFFANYSPAGQMGQMGQRFSETLRVPRVRGTHIIFKNYCPICPICPKTSLSEQKSPGNHGVGSTDHFSALKICSLFLTFEQLTSLLSDELAQPWCATTPIAALRP